MLCHTAEGAQEIEKLISPPHKYKQNALPPKSKAKRELKYFISLSVSVSLFVSYSLYAENQENCKERRQNEQYWKERRK